MAKASVEMVQGFEQASLADEISMLVQQWNNGRSQWLERVKEVTEYVYATSTRETTNVKNPWSHSTHIPKLTQIYDNLGANYSAALFGRRDFFDFRAGDRESSTKNKTQGIVTYLRNKHEYSGFFPEMKKCLNDWVRTGNCFVRLDYVVETVIDPIGGGDIITYEGPKATRISPYDITFDYTARSFEESPKAVTAIMTRGELLRKIENSVDEYDQEQVEKALEFYSILAGWSRAEINKHVQFNNDGFSDYANHVTSGRVEVMDFMGDIYDPLEKKLYKDQLITVLDRRFIIRRQRMDNYQGFGKIYHSGWRKRPDNLWAQGPLDNLVGMQYLINHLENARADGFDQMLAPDRVLVGQVEIEHDGPITNYYIDDGNGSVNNLAPDGTVLQADTQIHLKELQMEAYAGAPRQAMGIRTPGEKTAFEVQQLMNAAERLFQNRIEDFEQEFVNPVLEGELELAVKNISGYDVAKTIDDDLGVEMFMEITKEDLTARGLLIAQGASYFERRARLSQELAAFSQILAGDPEMKLHYPAKARAQLWEEVLGFEQFNLYKPFGAIEEQLELMEVKQAAQGVADEIQAAGMTDNELQDQAAGITAGLPA